MQKQSVRLVLGFAAVAVILGFGLWGSRKPGPSLPSIQIASIAEWPEGGGSVFSSEPYLWLTDHELLHFGNTPRGTQASSYDTRTRADTPEPGLTAVQSGHVVSASPDGQWVLWNTQKFSDSAPGMAATRRADGLTVRWPKIQTDSSAGFWLPDSRRWISILAVPTGQTVGGHPAYRNTFAVFSVDHPGFRSFPMSANSLGSILGVNAQGHVILGSSSSGGGGGQPQPSLSLVEVSPNIPESTARPVQVPQPQVPPGQFAEILLSPQGDCLLWACFSARPAFASGLLNSWTRHQYFAVPESLDLWVVSLDGSPPRHLGTWQDRQLSFAPAVRWNPDGRHISFTRRGMLQSVAVD